MALDDVMYGDEPHKGGGVEMNPSFGQDAPDELEVEGDGGELEESVDERKPLTPNRPPYSTYAGGEEFEDDSTMTGSSPVRSTTRPGRGWRPTSGEPGELSDPDAGPSRDELRRQAAQAAADQGALVADPRKSKSAQVVLVLLMIAPGIDLLLFLPQPDTSSLVVAELERLAAQLGRMIGRVGHAPCSSAVCECSG